MAVAEPVEEEEEEDQVGLVAGLLLYMIDM